MLLNPAHTTESIHFIIVVVGLLPRMGHLLLNGVFEEEKYDRGMIKLLRKPSEEEELEVFKILYSSYHHFTHFTFVHQINIFSSNEKKSYHHFTWTGSPPDFP